MGSGSGWPARVAEAYAGGPAGDLYLVVRIAPHRRYRLEGRDLHVQVPVSPWEAALGATVPVETPGGEVKVRVTPGSSSGAKAAVVYSPAVRPVWAQAVRPATSMSRARRSPRSRTMPPSLTP